MQEKKYSCYTRLRRNHSLLLLKNCKSPNQSQITAVSSKKDHHWSKKKIQKLCLGLKKLVIKVDVIKQAFKKRWDLNVTGGAVT